MTINPDAAFSRGDIMRRLADLEGQVRALQTGRRLESASIGQGGITIRGGDIRVLEDGSILISGGGDLRVTGGGTVSIAEGDITVTGGGNVQVRDGGNVDVTGGGTVAVREGGMLRVLHAGSDAVPILRVGPNQLSTGQDISSLEIRRPDGSLMLWAHATETGGGFIGVFDKSDNYIVTDDADSGRGLARPYLPLPVGEITAPTATTTSGTFTDLAVGNIAVQHPVLYALLLVRASDGTTAGETRLALDGTGIGPVVSIAAGVFEFVTVGPFAVPDPGAFGALRGLSVQARRTAGSGDIGVRAMSILGLESAFL